MSQQGNVLGVHALPTAYNQEYQCFQEAVLERQRPSVRDPVCGMELNPQHAAATTAYQGQTFYFCRVECQQQFDQSPERYVKAA